MTVREAAAQSQSFSFRATHSSSGQEYKVIIETYRDGTQVRFVCYNFVGPPRPEVIGMLMGMVAEAMTGAAAEAAARDSPPMPTSQATTTRPRSRSRSPPPPANDQSQR